MSVGGLIAVSDPGDGVLALIVILFNAAGLLAEKPIFNAFGLFFALWFAVIVAEDFAEKGDSAGS